MSRQIYLDHAAATPLDERVFRAMQPFLTEYFYNPSAPYLASRNVKTKLDEARQEIAETLGVKRDEIILTAGATESINLALQGAVIRGEHVVIGATEHNAVNQMAERTSYAVAKSDDHGHITPDAVANTITDATTLVSITAADSELGTIQQLSKIAELLTKIRYDRRKRGVDMPLYFHSDASQVAGVIDLHVSRLGVDLLTLNASKCYGPKQVGLLWAASHVRLEPLIYGGGQERGLRSGTENVAGIVGFAAALMHAQKHRHGEAKRLSKLRDELEAGLQRALPLLVVNGSRHKRLPGQLHVSYPGVDAERVIFNLDAKGIQVATGAACAANKGERSSVLRAVGMSDELANGSLRISLGKLTRDQDIADATIFIAKAIEEESGL
jgi:cysteine desulfurase